MSKQDLIDAGPTIERIGTNLDRIGRAGWPDLHAALAGYVRERRGKVKGLDRPRDAARDLLDLADELDRLAAVLAPHPEPTPGTQLEPHPTPKELISGRSG